MRPYYNNVSLSNTFTSFGNDVLFYSNIFQYFATITEFTSSGTLVRNTEVVVRRCFVKKKFLKFSKINMKILVLEPLFQTWPA